MLKEIIYSTISVIIIVWMMWFIIPMLKTVFNNEMLVVNATGPMVAPVLPVANTWFLILPLFIPLVGGFIIVAYAVRNLAEDYFQKDMMRAIAALFMGVLTALYAILYAIPMLYTAKTNSLSLFNQTDPVISQSIAIGNGFYNIIPLVPIFVGIFAIAAVSIRREYGE